MSVSSAIYDILLTSAGITGIVGEKIYPSGQPEHDTLPPYLVQEIVGSERPGLLNGSCPTANYSIRITGVADSEPTLRQLMDAVELCLDGLKVGSVKGIHVQDTSTNPDPTNPSFHSESHTYSVWYARS